MEAQIKGALFGLSVGDALGVPVEFNSRAILEASPVVDMQGYGTHNVPIGTWSDDSSLTFCLAETIAQGFDLYKLGQSFCKWRYEKHWVALPEIGVFDIGNTTQIAIERLSRGERPDLAGEIHESSNGNGSLMRILPLAFYMRSVEVEERYLLIKQVSSLTHGHARSVMACHYYLEFAGKLLQGIDKHIIYKQLQSEVMDLYGRLELNAMEVKRFSRLLLGNINQLHNREINSSGYVIDTLEAAIWCFLTTDNYKDCVLTAVNLGGDTDTTAAVVGGLAGMYYGYEAIPENWVKLLARRDDITLLVERMSRRVA